MKKRGRPRSKPLFHDDFDSFRESLSPESKHYFKNRVPKRPPRD